MISTNTAILLGAFSKLWKNDY